MSKKPKGEVHEIINALEALSTQNGQRPDVVQNKRDCFQVRASRRGCPAVAMPACLLEHAGAEDDRHAGLRSGTEGHEWIVAAPTTAATIVRAPPPAAS